MSWNLHEVMSCFKLSVKLSSNVGKRWLLTWLPAMQINEKEMSPRHSGKLFNTHSTDRWKSKKGQQFTLLRRITRLKTVNSDVVLLSTVSLERLSPRGSYHLDGTGMSDTLDQKHLTEFLVWSASFVHKQFSKSARKLYRRFDVRKPERSILAAEFWCSSNFRKPCNRKKPFVENGKVVLGLATAHDQK